MLYVCCMYVWWIVGKFWTWLNTRQSLKILCLLLVHTIKNLHTPSLPKERYTYKKIKDESEYPVGTHETWGKKVQNEEWRVLPLSQPSVLLWHVHSPKTMIKTSAALLDSISGIEASPADWLAGQNISTCLQVYISYLTSLLHIPTAPYFTLHLVALLNTLPLSKSRNVDIFTWLGYKHPMSHVLVLLDYLTPDGHAHRKDERAARYVSTVYGPITNK